MALQGIIKTWHGRRPGSHQEPVYSGAPTAILRGGAGRAHHPRLPAQHDKDAVRATETHKSPTVAQRRCASDQRGSPGESLGDAFAFGAWCGVSDPLYTQGAQIHTQGGTQRTYAQGLMLTQDLGNKAHATQPKAEDEWSTKTKR